MMTHRDLHVADHLGEVRNVGAQRHAAPADPSRGGTDVVGWTVCGSGMRPRALVDRA